MLNSRKRIIVSISLLAVIFIALIGITYAYYATNVTGNTSDTPSLNLKSGYLAIKYTDGSSSITGGSTSSTTGDLVYTKTFTIENTGVAVANYGIWIKNYSVKDSSGNATSFSRPQDWTYVLSSGETIIKTGTFPTSDAAIITAKPLKIGESQTLTLTVTYDYITAEEGGTDQSADQGKTLSFDVTVTQSLDNLESAKEGTLLYAINRDNVVTNPVTVPGQAPSSDTEAVLASTEDDYGTSYYFRGNVTNNFVTYAGMCWRIVRIQGDGTIKLVLADGNYACSADVAANSDGTYSGYNINNGKSAFIADPDLQGFAYKYNFIDIESDAVYANSDIPELLDTWMNGGTYKYENILSGYRENGTFSQKISEEETYKLALTEWCNDTSVTSKRSYDTAYNEIDETDENFDELLYYTDLYYGAYDRLYNRSTANPSLKCNSVGKDGSTPKKYVSNVGILSADEVAFAGGGTSTGSNSYYLYTNANSDSLGYWTLSPQYYNGNDYSLLFWCVKSYGLDGKYTRPDVYDFGSVRPAVVLASDVEIEDGGNGQQNTPYVIR